VNLSSGVKLFPFASRETLDGTGHELGAALDSKMAIEGGHVLMGRVVAQAEMDQRPASRCRPLNTRAFAAAAVRALLDSARSR
jgi:hypothetical protein